MDQPQPAQHAEECKVLGDKRCQQQGQHDDQIRKGVDARQFPLQVIGDTEPGREVQNSAQAEPSVHCGRNRLVGSATVAMK